MTRMSVFRLGLAALSAVPLHAACPPAGFGDFHATFDTPAADSAAARRLYNASSFSNPATSRSLAVVDGALTLTTTLAMEGSATYSANAGIILPLNNLWAPVDLRSATAISFRIWGNQTYKVNFALGSDIYPFADDGVVKVKGLPVTTVPTLATVLLSPVPEIEYLDWMINESKYPGGTTPVYVTDPSDPQYSSALNVASGVKQLQFNIDPTWGTGGKSVTKPTGSTTLSVDDIQIVGYQEYPNIQGVQCATRGPEYLFSDMSAASGNRNALGGSWYAFSDTVAAGAVPGDANGSSRVVLPEGRDAWGLDTTLGAATLVADLDRRAAGASRPYGGWAAIATDLPGPSGVNLSQVLAFGFQIKTDLDPAKIAGVTFKVHDAITPDSATHQVVIPVRSTCAEGGVYICVDLDQLKMPAFLAKLPDGSANPGYRSLDSSKIRSLGWEIKLANASDTVAAGQSFSVGPVKFYGQQSILGVRARAERSSALRIAYANGVLSLLGDQGFRTVEVLRLDGTSVAKVAATGSIPLDLAKGTYLLRAEGQGRNWAGRLAVMR